jgi:hypothetical protein
MVYYSAEPVLFQEGRAYTMGADLANRGCAGLDERIDVDPCCSLIFLSAQVFLCANEINYPFRECVSVNTLEQGWEFEVGMKVYQSRHQNRVLQPDNTMVGKPFFNCVFSADRQYEPSIDNYCTIFYELGP